MAEFPALQLWTDAYLGDTTHLSTIEHGAYLLLLMTAWRTHDCALPDDDKMLARYARLTPAQWARVKPIVMSFWRLERGAWTQGRLSDEREAVKRKSERGKAGADAKWLKHNKARHAPASVKHMPNSANHNHNHNHIQNTPTGVQKSGDEPPDQTPEKPKAIRGARLPADWEPDLEAVERAGLMDQIRELIPAEDRKLWADEVVAAFIDYWHAKAGQAATKLDWQATFNNWLRKELRDVRQRKWSTARWQEARVRRGGS